MCPTTKRFYVLAIGMVGCITFSSRQAWANTITYPVLVDTSAVAGLSGFLDFQFAPGDATTQPAFVTLTNFITDGTLLGPPNVNGGVTGTLPGTLTIDNSTAFNDYFEQFTFGSSFAFNLMLDGPALQIPNGTANSGSTFGLALFDSAQNPILTADPNGFAGLVNVKLDGSTFTTVFASDSHGGAPVVQFVATPEPSTIGPSLLGLLSLSWLSRRRRKPHVNYSGIHKCLARGVSHEKSDRESPCV
jgi:hypothetical protein